MRVRFIQIVITVVAAIAAILHSWFPSITIDAITVTLLGIAVLPWLGPLFKSVEIPGGVKVEFQELEKARKKVEESGLIVTSLNIRPMEEHEYAFQAVVGNDSNLALAGLRIEIESRLREMAKQRGIKAERASLGGLMRALESDGALSGKETSAIRDLLPLLNQAAHGAETDPSAFEWAMDFGPRVLGALEDRLGEATTQQLIEKWRHRDGAGVQDYGTELSKSLVQAPNAFFSAMAENPKDFDQWLEDIETHTFTIFSSSGELEDKLMKAYLNRLRELMVQAAESCRDSDQADLAIRVVDVLESVQIRRIW
ncbi:MAG: hypothetical protein AAGI27_00640 [Pseudomonadota bacterium]